MSGEGKNPHGDGHHDTREVSRLVRSIARGASPATSGLWRAQSIGRWWNGLNTPPLSLVVENLRTRVPTTENLGVKVLDSVREC